MNNVSFGYKCTKIAANNEMITLLTAIIPLICSPRHAHEVSLLHHLLTFANDEAAIATANPLSAQVVYRLGGGVWNCL